MSKATRKWDKRAEHLKKLRATDNAMGGTRSEEYVKKFKRPGKLIRAAL